MRHQIAARCRIKPRCRFIQQQDLWLGQQGAGNLGAALVAARQAAHGFVEQRNDVHHLGYRDDPLFQALAEQAKKASKEFQIGAHGNVGIQRARLKHDAQLAQNLR